MKSIVDQLDRDKIDQIIDALYETWKNGKRMYMMGNGGSGATASHLVNDFGKCTALPGKKRFKVLGLTDNPSLITAEKVGTQIYTRPKTWARRALPSLRLGIEPRS